MSAFVVLAVALAVAIVAVTGVLVVHLARETRKAADDIGRSVERLKPLAEELAAELAVTETELAALQERTAGAGDEPGEGHGVA